MLLGVCPVAVGSTIPFGAGHCALESKLRTLGLGPTSDELVVVVAAAVVVEDAVNCKGTPEQVLNQTTTEVAVKAEDGDDGGLSLFLALGGFFRYSRL